MQDMIGLIGLIAAFALLMWMIMKGFNYLPDCVRLRPGGGGHLSDEHL